MYHITTHAVSNSKQIKTIKTSMFYNSWYCKVLLLNFTSSWSLRFYCIQCVQCFITTVVWIFVLSLVNMTVLISVLGGATLNHFKCGRNSEWGDQPTTRRHSQQLHVNCLSHLQTTHISIMRFLHALALFTGACKDWLIDWVLPDTK